MRTPLDYWYGGHSEQRVAESAHRQTVLRPVGLFIFDGETVPRDDPAHSATPTRAASTGHPHPQRPTREGKRTHSPLRTAKTKKSEYYSRFATPKDELELDRIQSERENTVHALKNIYHDDSYLRRQGGAAVTFEASRRLLLPSLANTEKMRASWERREVPVRDEVFEILRANVQKDSSKAMPRLKDA